MGYAILALAIGGFAAGTRFSMRGLLPILLLLLLASVALAIVRGFSATDTALMVVLAQAIVQAAYFLGLIVRAFWPASIARHAPAEAKPVKRFGWNRQ
jgi:hypothetical protein